MAGADRAETAELETFSGLTAWGRGSGDGFRKRRTPMKRQKLISKSAARNQHAARAEPALCSFDVQNTLHCDITASGEVVLMVSLKLKPSDPKPRDTECLGCKRAWSSRMGSIK